MAPSRKRSRMCAGSAFMRWRWLRPGGEPPTTRSGGRRPDGRRPGGATFALAGPRPRVGSST